MMKEQEHTGQRFLSPEDLNFDDATGLIPCVVQDVDTREVLMVAYMNRDAYEQTLQTGYTWFFSRKRQSLWQKGESSGNKQQVVSMWYDCDEDTLLVLVKPQGPSCHTGARSCFYRCGASLADSAAGSDSRPTFQAGVLADLQKIVQKRLTEKPEGSYTTKLVSKGDNQVLKKVGEEATELVMACKEGNHQEMVYEGSDLLFHLVLALTYFQVDVQELVEELSNRHLNRVKSE